jgi:hypothetical protein
MVASGYKLFALTVIAQLTALAALAAIKHLASKRPVVRRAVGLFCGIWAIAGFVGFFSLLGALMEDRTPGYISFPAVFAFMLLSVFMLTRVSVSTSKSQQASERELSSRRELSEQQRNKIIKDYGAFFEHHPTLPSRIDDVSVLPHPKEAILDALCAELTREKDPKRVSAMRYCALGLAQFQPGVGAEPIHSLGIDIGTAAKSGRDMHDVLTEIAHNSNSARWQHFNAMALEDANRVRKRLIASEAPPDIVAERIGPRAPVAASGGLQQSTGMPFTTALMRTAAGFDDERGTPMNERSNDPIEAAQRVLCNCALSALMRAGHLPPAKLLPLSDATIAFAFVMLGACHYGSRLHGEGLAEIKLEAIVSLFLRVAFKDYKEQDMREIVSSGLKLYQTLLEAKGSDLGTGAIMHVYDLYAQTGEGKYIDTAYQLFDALRKSVNAVGNVQDAESSV